MCKLTIVPADPCSPDAMRLMDALSDVLEAITGRSGRASFNAADVQGVDGCFLLAYRQGKAVGCGGFRPMGDGTVEIKRVYAAVPGEGIGQSLFHELLTQAREKGYSHAVLETGRCNTRAMTFYQRLGGKEIPNYGRYAGLSRAACFEWTL